MVTVGGVKYDIKGDNSNFSKDVEGSKKIAMGAAKAIGGAFVTAMAAASAAVVAAATAGLKYNAQMEQYATSFEVMLGSSEAALAKIAELKAFAASTPFEMTDLANATKVMLGFGIEADKASDMLRVLGDISQGDSQKLGSLTLAFSQMSSTGRLMGQDLLQMINAGFNPLNEISKKTGETMAEVKTRMEAGAVSADEVTEAFKSATAEGGLFYQSMEKQSKTFNGQMSTLKDNAMSFLGELTTGLSDIAKNKALPFLNEQMQTLQTAFSESGFEGLFDAFGEVLGNLSEKLVEAIPTIVQFGADLVIALMEGLASSSDVIATAAGDLIRILGQAFIDFVPLLFEIAASLLTGLVQGIADNAAMLVDGAFKIVTSLVDSITKALPVLIPAAVKIITEVAKALTSPDNLMMLIKSALDLVLALAFGLVEAIPELMDVVPDIIVALVDMLLDPKFIGMLLNAGIQLIFALIQGIISSIFSIIESADKIKNAFLDVFKKSAENWKGAGKDIISGIWNGIKSSWDSLVSNFTSKMGGLIKSIKRMLGINSPSTVMKDIFVNFVAGGDVGFDDEFPDFERKVTRQYGGLFNDIRAENSVMPVAALAGGGGNVLQLSIPVQIDGREVARTTAEYTGQQLSWLQ